MRWIVGIVALMVVAWLGGRVWYDYTYPETRMRYRLTLEVSTPEGLHTGSGVIEVGFGVTPSFITERDRFYGTIGEAVAVDLGTRGTLFALLRSARMTSSDAPFFLLQNTYGLVDALKIGNRAAVEAFRGMSGRREVAARELPLMVRFGDMSDPKTVAAVDPANLAASFGDGVALTRVSVDITSDPVTRGIEKRLGWLSRFAEPNLDPDGPKFVEPVATAPLRRLLHHGDFQMGLRQ